MNNYPFIYKYKPTKLDDIAGNTDNINYIQKYIKQKLNYNLIFHGPTGIGKTITSSILLKELQIDFDHSLCLNLSDIRGLIVVNTTIEHFLEKKNSTKNVNTLILDEVDNLTTRAQYMIRELIEKYSSVRFILICNNINNIIENIQSKFTILKYNLISQNDISIFLKKICLKEKINPSDDGIDTIANISDGDIRKSLNFLQKISAIYPEFTKEQVYEICDYPHPLKIISILDKCKNTTFDNIIPDIKNLYLQGYSFYDLISTLFKIIKTYNMSEESRLQIISEIGFCHVRNASGVQSYLQLLRIFCIISKIIN
jgi:replication factor C subunit 2/4